VGTAGEGRGGEGVGRGGREWGGEGGASARTPLSARTLGYVCTDAPCPRGRPDDVCGCPNEKDVRTDIFTQKRPL
jgi:hypothetical protein